MHLREVQIHPTPLERFEPLIGPERAGALYAAAELARRALHGRVVFIVNSTEMGGGVAEMLQPLLAYSRGAGINARWFVIRGDEDFFRITKRLHNRFHGALGDGGPLGERERATYEAVLHENALELAALIEPRDVVLLHDPQTAGLIPLLRRSGALVVWRSHVGTEQWNEPVHSAWSFIRPYIEQAATVILTRSEYAPDWLRHYSVIPPSIDPFSVKNEPLDEQTIRSILCRVGILRGKPEVPAIYSHRDGTPGRIDHCADLVRAGPPPPSDVPLVVQVSRWDRLKDMLGVMHGFARRAATLGEAHLALVGPNVSGVSDDPEGSQVLDECTAAWRELPHAVRQRIQLVCLPMIDRDENAAIVNALQRHAAVVVQKSLAEGFGLTVAEAMWKARPTIGSAVGGIVEQIVEGESGLLLDPPTDVDAFGAALERLLSDREFAERLGRNAHQRVLEHFIGSRHLIQYAKLFSSLESPHPVQDTAPAPGP
ncbi:glycosyltransferase [Vitiosangium sp. GDMCC 1.1324]|uniref:glycosyltransferase n=1 Tax=Vitiosangium sp. (strain GDMCC 1.1324) TaxID=2138576 RepID=UPI000D36C32A|nr:glycosyltransferase [Vitiosangium sp. GDMCC 1.1324]PTL77261.1 glycosyl transferase family 1 [Vitiosangium sp. GDMCC 1.1324]